MSKNLKEHSKLCSRADLVDWLKTMLPDPWDYQGVTGSTYQQEIRELEYVSRPLWAIFSLIASGDYDEMLVLPYIERIKYELNLKTKTVFLKPTTKTRQIAVEMAVYGYGLLCCQDKLLNYFSNEEIEYLETWLNSINEIEFPQNNWLLFLLIVNCGLKKNNLRYSQAKIDEAKAKINDLYVGNGWYQDGVASQRDYYIAFGFHFYSMILSKYTDEFDRETVKERCWKFQEDFKYWIDQQGRTLQFGRSLSYRFGHVAFWVGQVVSENYNYELSEVKEIIFRNLNYWHDFLITQNNMITVGCGYPNLLLSEDYNAPGSPAWALKTFVLLTLPGSHSFWQIEAKKRINLNTLSCQGEPGFLIIAGIKHHYALSGFQYSKGHVLQHHAKYGKFCYSTGFGWNLSRDVQGIESYAIDNALALSVKGTEQYVSRGEIQKCVVHKDYLYSKWNYGVVADIETWLVPIDEDYHLRIHRIVTDMELQAYEGAFPVWGWHYKFNQPIVKDKTIILENDGVCSGIRDIFKNRIPVAIKQNPNTNIYDCETNGVACLYGVINKGQTLLGSLVYGDLQGNCPNMMIPLKFEHQLLEFKNKKIYLEEF